MVFIYFEGVFNETVIPLAFVGGDIIIADSSPLHCAFTTSCKFLVN